MKSIHFPPGKYDFKIENTTPDTTIIQHTINWIQSVVIGCNFCPFAAKALLKKTVRYTVLPSANTKAVLEKLMQEIYHLDEGEDIETTFIILPDNFGDFSAYLDLVEVAEKLIEKEDYEGVYQLASFHPQYCFAGESPEDAANYTNRSPYPMLHILREDSITNALENFPDPESIPEKNIAFARNKGLAYMQELMRQALGQ
ncbi:MAG: DUF1415 domain-containing protein [Bacteroidota bacterium]